MKPSIAKKSPVAAAAASRVTTKRPAAKARAARPRNAPPPGAELFQARTKKRIPFEFVLDELASLDPETRPMFGCTAVYAGGKILMTLRERPSHPHDNGVWIATTREHHASLRAELPGLRSITVLGDGVTGWQILPADAPDFEESVLHACALVRRGDPRIGKVPAGRRAR